MPDQVWVPDPLPKRKPTVSAPLPVKMSQDLLLHHHQHHYDFAPPGTSPSGGGLLLLSSRSLSPLKRIPSRHGSQDWRLPAGTSPHSSSGYSDGSCGRSPARSPKDSSAPSPPAEDDEDTTAAAAERPLSLVIRKNRTHLADPNCNVPEYTVHQRGPSQPRCPPYAPTTLPPVLLAEVEEDQSRDSGTEEDLEPPLVISEPQDEDEEEQLTARDLSVKKTIVDNEEAGPSRPKSSCEEDEEAEDKETAVKGSIIKIRDFARFSAAVSEENQTVTAAAAAAEDNISDLSSECPESLSSVDTWQSSFTEGRPFVPGASNVVMRRVSAGSNTTGGNNNAGEPGASAVAYQCDFCERIFGSKSHLQSHLVTHTGERAFNCRMCEKTFGRKSTLRAHMTTHTKTSNFMCTVCEKACNDNNSLEEHMRMHTGNTTNSITHIYVTLSFDMFS